VGSIARGERTAKWNEILRIEESMSDPVFGHDLAGLAEAWRDRHHAVTATRQDQR
jgi:hypothetical protein